MKILHVNNVADVPRILATEQRKHGHVVKVLTLKDDLKFPVEAKSGHLRFLAAFGDWDIIHLHSCALLPFYLDMPILKWLNKNVIIHHHGTDIRNKGCKIKHFGNHLVSTPDLLEWCPRAIYLPNPIELSKWKSTRKGSAIPGLLEGVRVHPTQMRAALDSRQEWHQIKVNHGVAIKGVSLTALQAIWLGKRVFGRYWDLSLYPSEFWENPRRYVKRYHDSKRVAEWLEQFYRGNARWT